MCVFIEGLEIIYTATAHTTLIVYYCTMLPYIVKIAVMIVIVAGRLLTVSFVNQTQECFAL